MLVTLRAGDFHEAVRAAVAALALTERDDLLDMKQIAQRYGVVGDHAGAQGYP